MGTFEDTRSITFWERIALARLWVLCRSRPQFHYAVDVIFQTLVHGTVVWLTVQLLNLFAFGLAVDFDLILHMVGPLLVGAVAAGLVRETMAHDNKWRGWIISGTYGGTAVLVFAILVELRWRSPTVSGAAAGFALGAAFFMLLHWLFELEARKNRAA
jgi:hypothetical protein